MAEYMSALVDILEEDLGVDIASISRDSRLIEDVGLDSLAVAIGAVAIEEKLGVLLTEEKFLACVTVGDLEDLIREDLSSE